MNEHDTIYDLAAAQYERMVAENERLRAALEWVTRCLEKPGPHMDKFAAIEKAQSFLNDKGARHG